MTFSFRPVTHERSSGLLVYRPDDYAFDVEPGSGYAFTSLMLNDVNLEIEEDARIWSVWGYCPYVSWKLKNLLAPPFMKGEVQFDAPGELIPGVSIQINKDIWPVFADPRSGWVCIDSGIPAERSIEVISGVLVALDSGRRLVSLWLKPQALPPALAEMRMTTPVV